MNNYSDEMNITIKYFIYTWNLSTGSSSSPNVD